MRVVSDQPGFTVGGSFAGSCTPHSATSETHYVWIVLFLLVASTSLALYDLYLLISAITAGA